MKNKAEQHYDKAYFEWQQRIGIFGGKANLFNFEKYIKPDDTVLDFGCGGGYLLDSISCKKKYGIDINDSARAEAGRKGIICQATIDPIPPESIDVIISNSCLGHCTDPYGILVSLKRILKKTGKIVFVVPCENSLKVKKDDVNKICYTWTPQNLANLFTVAGYEVTEAECIKSKWPPMYEMIQKLVGWKMFHIICKLYCRIRRTGYQTRVAAVLPEKE